jgi:hypothetical protein
MRWLQTVGMVRWCRFGPKCKGILSGGVGLVRWCRFGMWDETWDFLSENRRVRGRVGGPSMRNATLHMGLRRQSLDWRRSLK